MKQIIQLHRSFLYHHTGIQKTGIYFGFIGLVCYFNYFTSFAAWKHADSLTVFAIYLAFFLLALLTGLAAEGMLTKQKTEPLLLIAPILFAFKIVFPANWLLSLFMDVETIQHWSSIGYWLGSAVFIIICIVLIYYKREKKIGLYGLKTIQAPQVYLLLILCMIPLLAAAAQQTDFQNTYPKAATMPTSSATQYILFELAYVADFFTIELFFRGLLIMALVKKFGMSCILPVALFYFTIHLGKPMAEAISSFFGGTVLGVIACYTKSIWGGFIVHVGIALLMELFGYLF